MPRRSKRLSLTAKLGLMLVIAFAILRVVVATVRQLHSAQEGTIVVLSIMAFLIGITIVGLLIMSRDNNA